jgi:hypothetical protein
MSSATLSAWVNTTMTKLGARLFRNNIGEAWLGQAAKTKEGGVYIKAPKRVIYGLRVGSSDKIGWTPVTVTPSMVGQTLAVFTAVEEKSLAYPTLTPDQRNFLDQVAKAGGLGYVARETAEGPVLVPWPEPVKGRRK